MKLFYKGVGLAVTFTQTAFASIVPENSLRLFPSSPNISSITQKNFEETALRITNLYKPDAAKWGAVLKPEALWENPKVNAGAMQQGNVWSVVVFGGLGRHPAMTLEALALGVCHELGHHFGGYPFYNFGNTWASAEGQADYFATKDCMKRAGYSYEQIKQASIDLAGFVAALEGNSAPSPEDQDWYKVGYNTDKLHPRSQCRLDTYLQGLQCSKLIPSGKIPGKSSSVNAQESISAEQDSLASSCNLSQADNIGARPRCWFKPQINYKGNDFYSWEMIETKGNMNHILEPGEEFNLVPYFKNRTSTLSAPAQILAKTHPEIASTSQTPSLVPEISPNTVRASEPGLPVRFKKDLPCGYQGFFDVETYSKQGNTESRVWVTLGRETSLSMGENNNVTEIPDNDPHGLLSAINVKVEKEIETAFINVELEHESPSDLTLYLVNPEGRKHFLISINRTEEKLIKLSLRRTFYHQKTNGLWRLLIIDKSGGSTGSLHHWSLSGTTRTCSL